MSPLLGIYTGTRKVQGSMEQKWPLLEKKNRQNEFDQSLGRTLFMVWINTPPVPSQVILGHTIDPFLKDYVYNSWVDHGGDGQSRYVVRVSNIIWVRFLRFYHDVLV